MKRTLQIVVGSVLFLIGIAFAFISLAICCTIVLLPFGLMMFTFSIGVGAVGLNMILGRSSERRREIKELRTVKRQLAQDARLEQEIR